MTTDEARKELRSIIDSIDIADEYAWCLAAEQALQEVLEGVQMRLHELEQENDI